MRSLFFLLFFFCFEAHTTSPEMVCRDEVKKLFISYHKKSFLNDLFEELVGIVDREKIVISNTKVRDIIFSWSSETKNPRVVDMFEVAKVFGMNVSDLLKHSGNLGDIIDPSKIVVDAPSFTSKEEHEIFDRVHLHLSGLINEILHQKNLTLEKLSLQTRIDSKLFHGIVNDMKLPHFPLLLQTLVRLNIDVVAFFKNVEIGLKPKTPPPYFKKNKSTPQFQKRRGDIERNAVNLFKEINRETANILKEIHLKDPQSDIARFENMIYYRNHSYRGDHLEKNINERMVRLGDLIQISHMLGMNVSEVLKYAGNLKSHVHLDGIKDRTLLGDNQMKELLGDIHKHFFVMFEQSGLRLEQLADMTQIPLSYLKDLNRNKLVPLYSNLERILQALDSDMVRFFEVLESEKGFDIHVSGVQSIMTHNPANEFIGTRIMKIWEILRSFFTVPQLDKAMVRPVNQRTGLDLTQRSAIRFKTLYKTSRTTNMTLSELVGERPVEKLFNPLNARIEPMTTKEIKRSEQLLAHLILSEARRQKDVNGLTVTGLAIKSNLTILMVRSFLSGARTPSYFALRQVVEEGLGISLPRFLENFEIKLKSFEHIPKASKAILLELEGPNLGQRVKANLVWVEKRIDQAKAFLKAVNIPLNRLAEKGISGNRNNSQMYTLVKFAHLFGISLRDFLGRRDFSEMTKPDRLIFNYLPEENILKVIGQLKKNINRRKETLGISTRDLKIKLGVSSGQKVVITIIDESIISLSLQRYFQLAEILAREGEDDLFLLDGIDL